MKASIKAQLELSEVREQINRLQELDAPTEAQASELAAAKAKYRELEGEYRAAVKAEDAAEERAAEDANGETRNGDGASVELRQLERKASIEDVVRAALSGAQSTGATGELQQHLGLQGNAVPLALLREERAATPAPADVGATQAAIVMPLFARTAASFLGVEMPTVGVGERVYPVLTTRPTVSAPAAGAEVAETTGAFDAEVLSPKRLQASFYFRLEDLAKFQGMEAALRTALNDGLGEALDNAIINGADGLLTGTNLADNAASAEATWADYRSQLAYGRVDGRWADSVSQLRVLVNPATYAHASTQYRTQNADGRSALAELEAETGGVRVSALMPAVASKKAEAIVRRGMEPAMVAPVWEGVRIIRDEVTKAATGEVVLTAIMLFSAKIIRAAGFHKQELQVEV